MQEIKMKSCYRVGAMHAQAHYCQKNTTHKTLSLNEESDLSSVTLAIHIDDESHLFEELRDFLGG